MPMGKIGDLPKCSICEAYSPNCTICDYCGMVYCDPMCSEMLDDAVVLVDGKAIEFGIPIELCKCGKLVDNLEKYKGKTIEIKRW